MNREEWLTGLTDKMRPIFLGASSVIPEKIRLTCGWPSKGAFSSKRRTIGECWPAIASKDGHAEVFVSPCVADSLDVAAILAHELVHACGAKGHRAGFKRIAKAIGLTGPMRSTVAGSELKERLNVLTQELGPYPHAELDKTQSPHKKDGTRLLKAECPACGYVVRVAKKWLSISAPTCTSCNVVMESDILAVGGDEQ